MTEIRLTLLLIYIVLFMVIYVIVWLPLINGLNNEVFKTKRVLLIIPIELLVSMKSLDFLLDKSKPIQA